MSESVSYKPLVVEIYTAISARVEQQEVERLCRMLSWHVGASAAWVEVQARRAVRSRAGAARLLSLLEDKP